MKRSFLILLAGVIGVILLFLFRPKQSAVNESSSVPTNAVMVLAITNSAAANIPAETTTQTAPAITSPEPKRIIDGIKTQSLADWTNAIPNIKQWSQFRGRSSWVAAPMDTNNYPIILLTGANGTIQFKAKLTSVDAMDDDVREIELHTPDMSIDETRKFGESLLGMMSKDKSDFDAWCDKVGNNWVDAPLYGS